MRRHLESANPPPLPLYASVTIADAVSENGDRFTITAGLSKTAVEQLIARSCDKTDEDLMRFTSDLNRFGKGLDVYEMWYAKERYPFALLDQTGALAAIVWFGPLPFPKLASGTEPSHMGTRNTFAVRVYKPYRGKHLAYPFASFVIAAYRELMPNPHALWLATHQENVGAIKLFEKLGFVECGRKNSGRVVMVERNNK